MIKIVGDICFSDGSFDIGFGIGSQLKNHYNPFEYLKFDSNDIWIGNLECVISDISNKSGVKAEQFRTPYNDVSSLHHLNTYCVANNHTMQHGTEAYSEMLANIKKLGSRFVGSLSNKSIIINHQEKKFGILSFSQRGEVYTSNPSYWYRPEYKEIENEFNQIKHCDFKIAYVHWGNEFMDYPYVEQKKFAHWLIDIGFDLLIGTHPHVLQGYEVYNGKYIFYSLGNFLFNMPTEETRYSAIINVHIEAGEFKIDYEYVFIDEDNKSTIIAKEKVPTKYLFETLNKKISFEIDNEGYYKNMFKQLSAYRRKNHYWMLSTLHKHKPKEVLFMLKDFIIRRIIR